SRHAEDQGRRGLRSRQARHASVKTQSPGRFNRFESEDDWDFFYLGFCSRGFRNAGGNWIRLVILVDEVLSYIGSRIKPYHRARLHSIGDIHQHHNSAFSGVIFGKLAKLTLDRLKCLITSLTSIGFEVLGLALVVPLHRLEILCHLSDFSGAQYTSLRFQ